MTAGLHPGLWGVLATPFDEDGTVDHRSLERQVHFARAAGSDGLVALGVFGEAANLSLAEQRAVASTVVSAAEGQPIVLGVSGRATAVAAEQAVNALEGARSPLRRPAGPSGEGAPDPMRLMVQVNSDKAAVVARHLHRVHAETGVGHRVAGLPDRVGRAHRASRDRSRCCESARSLLRSRLRRRRRPPRSASSRSTPTCPSSVVSAESGSSTSSPWARLER